MRHLFVSTIATVLGLTFSLSSTLASASVAQDYAEALILEMHELISNLDGDDVSTPGHQVALLNFYRQALEAIEAGELEEALKKLDDAKNRADGCSTTDSPDVGGRGADWVTNCSVQVEIVQSTDLASVFLTSIGLGYSEDSVSETLNAGQQNFPNPIGGGSLRF